MKRQLTTAAIVAGVIATIIYVNRLEPNRASESRMLKQASEALRRSEPPRGDTRDGKAFFERNALRDEVHVLPSGVQYEVLVEGTGEKLKPYDKMKAHYEGSFLNGNVFQSTYELGEAYESPPKGWIQGLSEVLPLMSVGDKWRAYIPPELAYGETGMEFTIPPNTMIIYDIEILEVTGIYENLRQAVERQAADASMTVPRDPNIGQLAAKNAEFLAEHANAEGVNVLQSGVHYRVIREGTGDKPGVLDQVKVHYRGAFIDDTQFDSSYDRGVPMQFYVSGVIPGWTQVLQLMREGAHWQIVVPPDMAYGSRGKPPTIPPNMVLVFDIELLEIVR